MMAGKCQTSGRAPWLPVAALCMGFAGACGGSDRGDEDDLESERQSPVIYGNDDRQDLFEYADTAWAADASRFTVALISEEAIEVTEQGKVKLTAPTLEQLGLCADERFAQQPAAAFCSGVLIAPDLVLTAGHCVLDDGTCESTKFVFAYQMDGPDELHELTADDVFSCAELLVQEQDFDYTDHAIVRLDRPTGRSSARVAPAGQALAPGTPLVVQGFPSGLPVKIDDGGRVRDGRAATRDHFIATLDTSAGSDGSGVFDRATGELVGILVTGETNYIPDGQTTCYGTHQCAEDGCDGQIVEYAFRALESLCATGIDSPLCPCGDGACNAAAGETTATCADDCGTSCGDGACNGDESAMDCVADCGTCGNAVCDAGEDQGTCCSDCGCAAPLVCALDACVPDAGAGDTCADAADLRPSGTYVVPGNTADAGDDFAGGCAVETNAPDRVYRITLHEVTWMQARVKGFDSIMYIRTECANARSELMCNDDAGPPEHAGSALSGWFVPGTYYLIVDGYGPAAGLFELEVSFLPPPSNDTCEAAVDIPATGTQVLTSLLDQDTARNDYQGTCGGDGNDHAYRFTTTACADVTALAEGIDSVLYLRSACTPDPADELACNDDLAPTDLSSQVSVAGLAPGTHYLIVDAHSAEVAGEYTLRVTFGACAAPAPAAMCVRE